MKLGFIGGSGHHYLRQLLHDPTHTPAEIAVASDGVDPAASAALRDVLAAARPDLPIRWFDDGHHLLDQFTPDLLSVGAVYGFNGIWNAAALQRNIPVVSDKPVAATWPQLDRLRDLHLADPSRVLLTEFDFHSRPECRAARQAVQQGQIGNVVLVTAQKSYRFGTRPPWYADRSTYGGTLLWVASHGIDWIPFVTGRRLVRFVGHQGNLSQPQLGSMEDHVALLAELDNGGTALVHADFCRPAAAPTHGDDRLRIAGTHGILEMRNQRCELITAQTPPTDITNSVTTAPMHLALLAAVAGDPSLYSTAQSLDTAETLLRARDATDRQQWTSNAPSGS